MNYWMAGPSNLSECATPLFDWVMACREVWRAQTVTKFHARGWTCRGETGIFGGMSWQWVAPSGAWLCQNLFGHYEFTQDREYLKRLYPVLKEVCEFWEDRLKALLDGTLVAPNDFSPEHGPIEDGVSFAQELVWEVFNDYVTHAQGLVAKDGPPKNFAIAGADKNFIWADAKLDPSTNTVVVGSPKVPKPVAVRYAWAGNPDGCNLYNTAGLPLAPFRTDVWPVEVEPVKEPAVPATGKKTGERP
jgi:hypothetical protein